MIAYIDGELTYKNPAAVIIDVNGVGYELNISLHTYEKIANLNRCKLLTHQVIKEDAHQLFGFFDENEKTLFRQLISISGIGPNTARMMLSSLPPEELKRAIIRGDVSLIKSVKGIGPKSAQRIVIELQDTLKKTTAEEAGFVTGRTKVVDEALAALSTLGFPRQAGEKAVASAMKASGEGITVEELIKQALKLI